MPAELRVLVAERVEAVRAAGVTIFFTLVAVERRDVLLRQHLEEVLVARRRAESPVQVSSWPRMANWHAGRA